MFKRILVANRGEIALRIVRACRELGIATVAVYSEADRDACHLKMADEAICIGPASPAESYLNIPRIISAAEIGNVEAIHPGYGFLAENAHFAEVCRSCKIEFIGPPIESMQKVGNKVEARKVAKAARVKIVPGSPGAVTDEEALPIAQKIGYPVMVKASAGGGGRGMRVAHNDISLRTGIKAARAESAACFGDDTIYVEKFIERPRHIEVQILADNDGTVIHLWERDCTIQRRHQKLIEESPSPHIKPATREEICKAAVRIMKTAGYVGAGTVEFLVDRKQSFYFMEVNARIQVEHPVTEMITGEDLIKWQLRIASGEKLTLRQRDVSQKGVSIECRINAEDPARNFAPCPGVVTHWKPPGGFGVRVDSHVYPGYVISPHYDSMIAKLIVHQPTRAEAIACMKRALEEFEIGPIKTTIPLHLEIFSHTTFLKGKVDTGFIERTWLEERG